eukprot:TRINITY_DN2822_c0_g1_i9.p1 TRINITY_DN2822_c0_g1~~TRINITY_DN2822_c0_g1_i9.p1  ORF type:complete len:1003 (-),score=166.34 TRINITY_DN2822_c0_g1_i9:253-3261(-)
MSHAPRLLAILCAIWLASTAASQPHPPGGLEPEHHSLNRFAGWENHLAVAVPFHISQFETKLVPALARWNLSEYAPCHDVVQVHGRATLVFLYSGDPDVDVVSHGDTLRSGIEKLWAELGPARNCFRGMQILRLQLDPANDKYSDAPCVIFGGMLQRLREAQVYDHVFQMETDVLPVRPNWLEALLRETGFNQGCERYWQRGSMAHCQVHQGRLAERYDVHINGNSIWCLRDPRLWEFLERVQSFFPPGDHSGVAGCGTAKWAEVGVDHAMYRFRRDPANFEYTRTILHLFTYTQTVLNKCEDAYTVPTLLGEHPRTFLVHSKAPFLPHPILMAREAVVEVFGRWPDFDEQALLKRMIESGSWTTEDLLAHLCQSSEAAGLLWHNNYPARCQRLCDEHQDLFGDPGDFCRMSLVKQQWRQWMPDSLYLWSVDLHSGPLACNSKIMREAGAVLHAEIDFGNCVHSKEHMCRDRLKVLENNQWRSFSLDPCPNFLRQAFFEAYKDDPEFERVDAFICSHPAANCELFMPFNRSLIVYPTTRLEFGRDDDVVEWRKPYMKNLRSRFRWQQWVTSLQKIAANPMNVVAANSKFEAAYIKYHTGIDALYLPTWCGDKVTGGDDVVIPTKSQILLGPYRDNLDYPRFSEQQAWRHPIMRGLTEARERRLAASGVDVQFVRLREEYPHYEYSDLQAHPCIVIIPYQVSVISFFEYYRLNIPIFVPSKRLLISWHLEHNTLWERVYGHPKHLVPDTGIPDPTSDRVDDLEFWVGLADYYHFEHVLTFDSWDDLIGQLTDTEYLVQVRHKMKTSNRHQRQSLLESWTALLANIKRHATPPREMPKRFHDALESIYGLPRLGPDLPVTLPKREEFPYWVPKDLLALSRDCPVIPDQDRRCMCTSRGKLPKNFVHCPDKEVGPILWPAEDAGCIPSNTYYPPAVGSDTYKLKQVTLSWWNLVRYHVRSMSAGGMFGWGVAVLFACLAPPFLFYVAWRQRRRWCGGSGQRRHSL